VLESAVFGVPSELGEDDVMAVVQLKPSAELTPEELTAHCKQHLARFMIPRYIEFTGALPKTGTHRTQKSVLKAQGVGPGTWDGEARAST
jgi:crotonobetaine/carnitine-CoA ligase